MQQHVLGSHYVPSWARCWGPGSASRRGGLPWQPYVWAGNRQKNKRHGKLPPLLEDDKCHGERGGKGIDLLPPEAQARLVKSALRSQGYPRRALVQLPEDGSQGSRELLLALSWLLARGPLLERLLAQIRVRLGDEMPVCEVGVR